MDELNDRQRAYLCALFRCDQDVEQSRRRRAARGFYDNTPASEWRWMLYGPVAPPSALYTALRTVGLVDAGTGSTWSSLARRGLVLTKEERDPLGAPLLSVQITAKGRKLARALIGEPAPQRLAPGTLKEWHWRALAAAWIAGEEGLAARWGGGDYGGISWNTWLRLCQYKGGGLVAEVRTRRAIYSELESRIYITPAGQRHYRERYAAYRAMYPEVEAYDPDPAAAREQLTQETRRVYAVLARQEPGAWIAPAQLLEQADVKPFRSDLWNVLYSTSMHLGRLRCAGYIIEREPAMTGDGARLVAAEADGADVAIGRTVEEG